MFKSYIWSLPTRVFHWLLALLILLAFLTDDDDLLNYHAVIGYAVLILLAFRVVWGYLGPKYSKFKDFPLSMNNVKEFMFNIFNSEQKYIGHNPPASYVMITMFVVIFLVIITGALTFGIQEGKGIFSFLNDSFFRKMELFEDLHEFFANFLVVLIVAHIIGVLTDKLVHGKHQTLNSIFTGYKQTLEENSIKLTIFHKLIAFIFLLAFIAFLVFNLMQPKNILIASKYEPIDYMVQNELFINECGACHTLYPPHSLPRHSWVSMMNDLENHFGDDASLEEEENQNILNFLVQNSAETSTQEMSFKISKSIGNKDIIAITQTSFWKNEHKKIPKEVFEHNEVKSKANCKACHSDIEKGLIEDDKIKNINAFL
ncbi:MAG: cytochrome b/b6 domain-containing protein [Arcobacteraceae bacterium]|nr:cytochrome b/b6 domain-containing protein [Arcobacteraceae bacterium]